MEYDPAVSTHKASSITSTTSTSSSSTWESSHSQHFDLTSPSFKDFNSMPNDAFMIHNNDFAAECISLHEPTSVNSSFGERMNSNIKSEYHEQYIANSEQAIDYKQNQEQDHSQLNDMTHDRNVYLTSCYNTPAPIYLQHGDQITVPFTKNYSNMQTTAITPRKKPIIRQIRPLHVPENINSNTSATRQRSNSITSTASNCTTKRQKSNNRDILTDDEKRVNHIASEQKRRNTIRLGFKELTDIIPTLKNINNSKSTILFKAVEYIKHLDKRNRGLREKISTLQVRMNVEGRMMQQQQQRQQQQRQHQHHQKHHQQQQRKYLFYQQNIPSDDTHQFSHLPANAISALLAHKNQQRQLEALQKQLRLQQQLLAKHNILPEHLATSPPPPSPPSSHSAMQLAPKQAFVTDHLFSSSSHNYNSISIPSSRSSNSDENDHLIIAHHQDDHPWQNAGKNI